MMLTPLLTALANRFLLKQPTPVGLWPTMAVAIGGSAMMISGEWLGDRGGGADAGGPSGRDMAIGLALSVASMLLLTAYLVTLQVSWCVGRRGCRRAAGSAARQERCNHVRTAPQAPTSVPGTSAPSPRLPACRR